MVDVLVVLGYYYILATHVIAEKKNTSQRVSVTSDLTKAPPTWYFP